MPFWEPGWRSVAIRGCHKYLLFQCVCWQSQNTETPVCMPTVPNILKLQCVGKQSELHWRSSVRAITESHLYRHSVVFINRCSSLLVINLEAYFILSASATKKTKPNGSFSSIRGRDFDARLQLQVRRLVQWIISPQAVSSCCGFGYYILWKDRIGLQTLACVFGQSRSLTVTGKCYSLCKLSKFTLQTENILILCDSDLD